MTVSRQHLLTQILECLSTQKRLLTQMCFLTLMLIDPEVLNDPEVHNDPEIIFRSGFDFDARHIFLYGSQYHCVIKTLQKL